MKKTSQEKLNEILDLYINQGYSAERIKAHFESKGQTCSTSSVSRLINQAGYNRADRGSGKYKAEKEMENQGAESQEIDSKKRHNILNEFINHGLTMTSILKRHNITASEFSRIVRQAGYGLMDGGVGGYMNDNKTAADIPDGVTVERNFKSGDIYYYYYEENKGRPVMLYGNDYVLNNLSYIPCLRVGTNKERVNDVPISFGKNGSVDCGQIMYVNKQNIGNYAHTVTKEELKAVNDKIMFYFGITEYSHCKANNDGNINFKRGERVLAPFPYISDIGVCEYKLRPCIVVSDEENNIKAHNVTLMQLSTCNGSVYANTNNTTTTTQGVIFLSKATGKYNEAFVNKIAQIDTKYVIPTGEQIPDEVMAAIEQKMIDYYHLSPAEITPPVIAPPDDIKEVNKEPLTVQAMQIDGVRYDEIDIRKLLTEREIYKDILYRMTGGAGNV